METNCTTHDDYIAECDALRRMGGRLLTVFAEEPVDGMYTVNALFAGDGEVFRVHFDTEGDVPSLTRIIPYAGCHERMMAEMSGVTIDGAVPAPIVYRRRGGGHPLQKSPLDIASEERVPLPKNSTAGDGVFEIPVGPVHAGIIEPGHFRFSVAGETVLELNPSLGYTHRGVERLLELPVGEDKSRLVERISGDTCVANSIAYAEMMESGSSIPRRAVRIRTMLAEMERLYNHIGAVSGVCTDTAFSVPSAIGGGIMEKVLRMNLTLTHHRQLMNAVVPGGIRWDIGESTLRDLDDFLIGLKFEVDALEEMMMESPSLQDRMETTGRLEPSVAREIGATGPIGRASGVPVDCRREFGYEAYGDLGMNMPVQTGGDVLARTKVRFAEITESFSLIHQCIQNMEPGETRVHVEPEDGFYCSVVEAPRGELVHSMHVRGGRIWRYHVCDPSFRNWFGMCHAVPGNVVPDFPLINKSFGLSYSGNDL